MSELKQFDESTLKAFTESTLHQRGGGATGLDYRLWIQTITLGKAWHGFIEFDVSGSDVFWEGSISDQTKSRRRYLTRTSDFEITNTIGPSTYSYTGVENYEGVGFCPQIDGSPASISIDPFTHVYSGVGTGVIFNGNSGWGVVEITGPPNTYNTNATDRDWTAQDVITNATQVVEQVLTNENTLDDVLTPLTTGIAALGWTLFDAYPQFRLWEIDEYATPTESGTLDTTSLVPGDYDASISGGGAGGSPYDNFERLFLDVEPENPLIDQREFAYSGWAIHLVSTPPGMVLKATRRRFKFNTGASKSYWIGRADAYMEGTDPDYVLKLGDVEVLSSGSLAADTVLEIPFPDTPASPAEFVTITGDTEDRLSSGRFCFAILDETPAEWSARTGYTIV